MIVRPIAALAALCLVGFAPIAQAADKPTDPQIAHIAYTAGVIDIEAAKQAIAKSKTKAVVDFANDMVRDHEAVNVQALDLVKKLNVTPEDNDTSKALTQAATDERAKLDKLDGAAFDKAYVENEVAYHKTGERRARNLADPVSQKCRAEEPARNRAQDIPGPPAACRACRHGTEIGQSHDFRSTAVGAWPSCFARFTCSRRMPKRSR